MSTRRTPMIETVRQGVARASWYGRPGRPSRVHSLLADSQWWDAPRLESLQLEALRDVLEAGLSVPLLRGRLQDAGLHPGDVDSLEALASLRPLERLELQRHDRAAVTTPGARGVGARSSGSTGRPVEALASLEQRSWGDAAARRAADWLGITPGARRVHVSAARALDSRRSRVNAALDNRTLVPVRLLDDPRAARRLLRSLERRPPESIEGLSNGLYLLARRADEVGAEVRPSVCWSGGNHLMAGYRRQIERSFGCRIFERYSAWETGMIAHQCQESSWHVVAETTILEVVRPDGTPAAPGEVGDVLVTSLRNKVMPLVRYRLGDRARAAEEGACPCGRSLPRLGELIGRSNEMLIAPDGRLIPPTVISRIMAEAGPSLSEFQVRQDRDKALHVALVQRDDSSADRTRVQVRRRLDELLGAPGISRVERVESIPPGRGGKLRHVISEASVE